MGGVVRSQREWKKSTTKKTQEKSSFPGLWDFSFLLRHREISTTERDVNATTERTELREKNHRSRLFFVANAERIWLRAAVGAHAKWKHCGSHEAGSAFCEWKKKSFYSPILSVGMEGEPLADSRKTHGTLVELLVKCFIFYFITSNNVYTLHRKGITKQLTLRKK